jgi:hypothetical protein
MKVSLNNQKEILIDGEMVARAVLTSDTMDGKTKLMTRRYALIDIKRRKLFDIDNYMDFRGTYKSMDWKTILKI